MSRHLIDAFIEMMAAERGASRHTISAYERDLLELRDYVQKHAKSTPLEDVDGELLHAFMRDLTLAGRSASTCARKLSSIKQFFSFLFLENIRDDNPSLNLERPKTIKSIPKFLTEEEVNRLFEATKQGDSPEDIRLRAILEILYASGLRVSELVMLKLSALQQAESPEGTVYFLVVEGKGRKERIVPLNQSAMDAINHYLDVRRKFSRQRGRERWLFPSTSRQGYLTRQRLGQLMKELAIRAEIDPLKVSPHVIRHSFASHLLQHGMDLKVLQDLLGHADISTTQIYTHLADKHLEDAVVNHHPLSNSGQKPEDNIIESSPASLPQSQPVEYDTPHKQRAAS